jgi:small subunit ribosomal protein S4
MARYTDAVCKLCRREGQKLFLKGDRCYTAKCSVDRRSYAPGQHGQGRKKPTEYSLQLRAKQTARRFYGLSESQFHRYYEIAARAQGVTGDKLLQLCESRLDNVVYLLGWGASRAEARQMVTHGHFQVDGRKVDIPSFQTKPGQVISIKEKSRDTARIKQVLDSGATRPVPGWLDLNREACEGKVVELPAREMIQVPVEEHLIVEFYSK